MEIERGDRVGRCPECGPVVRDDVDMTGVIAVCGICGDTLDKYTIASHDTRLTQAGFDPSRRES
jgi:hypothetical protein